jgi:hypothetical protein
VFLDSVDKTLNRENFGSILREDPNPVLTVELLCVELRIGILDD